MLLNCIFCSFRLFVDHSLPTSKMTTVEENYHPLECLSNMNTSNFLEDPSEKTWKGPFTIIQGADS